MKKSDDEFDAEPCRKFVEKAKVFFAALPEVQHTWSIDGDEDHCFLIITGKGTVGYDITLEVSSHETIVFAEGYRGCYSVKQPLEGFVKKILDLVRDMMSPTMRIREVISNSTPCQWYLQRRLGGSWQTESSSQLTFWDRFGEKTEQIYVNEILPARV